MMMNKANADQSMEEAIAEALAAVDTLADDLPAGAPQESLGDIGPGESPDADGEDVTLDLDAAVTHAAQSVAEPAVVEPAAEPAVLVDDGAAKALDELKTRHMRLMADFDNYRKRVQREQSMQRLYASENVLRELLSVVDNIERAIAVSDEAGGAGSLREGINMILNQMLATLERSGVKTFTSIGTEFNPERHEAVARQGHNEYEEDIVCEEMQKGYMLHDRLLRAASVVVSAGKLDSATNSSSNSTQGPEAES
jgi:molecular chaperone GrpE